MRLESQQSNANSHPTVPHVPELNRDVDEAAHRWLAQFAPLLDGCDALSADDTRARLEALPKLRDDGRLALSQLEAHASQADPTLLDTLRSSLLEIEAAETDLRRRLGFLAPGDPQGQVDLEAIQQKLAESAARREVGSWETRDTLLPHRLEVTTSPPNWAGAALLGIFSLGWNAFTTIHAVLFIGGFWRAIGPFALFFLFFYAMFWAAGLAMALGAFTAACREKVVLEGRRMTVTRTLLGYDWRREHALAEAPRARFIEPLMEHPGTTEKDVAVRDASGREVRLASGRPREEQERLIDRLNEYLGVAS